MNFSHYESWLRAGGSSNRTVRERTSAARRLLRIAGVDDPRSLTNLDVVTFIGRGASAWSRVTYYNHALALSRFLSAAEGVDVDFMQGVPKCRIPKGVPRPINANELAAALALAHDPARTMLLLAAYAGLRVSEIAAVHGEDVSEAAIYVRGKGGRQDMVPTHPVLWRCAQEHPRVGPWFPGQNGGQISASRCWRHQRTALDQVGSKATPHQVRHFYGTSLLNAGANIRVVQELMRHANLSSTEIYTQVKADDRRRAIEG